MVDGTEGIFVNSKYISMMKYKMLFQGSHTALHAGGCLCNKCLKENENEVMRKVLIIFAKEIKM